MFKFIKSLFKRLNYFDGMHEKKLSKFEQQEKQNLEIKSRVLVKEKLAFAKAKQKRKKKK